mmetsp:Transcript_36314/g.40534  ORF Transcript_36314/g.40534 Transcript_36314/m.40534 type:complete len:100 (-) Transcript_36314:734-1033(-)
MIPYMLFMTVMRVLLGIMVARDGHGMPTILTLMSVDPVDMDLGLAFLKMAISVAILVKSVSIVQKLIMAQRMSIATTTNPPSIGIARNITNSCNMSTAT